MTLVKVTIWIFVFVVGGFALYLGVLNRASEKVATNLPTALALSALAALLTLIFSLQREERSLRLPVEYIVDPTTLSPYSCDFFPPMLSYSDPGWGTGGGPAFIVLMKLAENKYKNSEISGDDAIADLYRDVLFRQILDTLRFTYLKSWDAGPTRFVLPTGTNQTIYAARSVRVGKRLSNAELVRIIGDSSIDSDTFRFLNLPPSTDVTGSVGAGGTTLKMANRFVEVKIDITPRAVASSLGKFKELCRLTSEQAAGFRRPSYEVTLQANFSEFRSGHPDMPLYRNWVDVMFSEIRQFDATQRWESVSREYLLLYSRRTETPLQEQMRETLQKAENRK